MALEDVKKFKIEIENACIPLSLKHEYLYSLNNLLEADEYSFFAVDKLKKEFESEVLSFNHYLDITFNYLKKNRNFLGLKKDSLIYKFLSKNIGVLIFMNSNFKALDIVREALSEKKFGIFKIDDNYILRLYELVCHLREYGSLPVQTDRNFKFNDGTYMGTFLARNKKKIYMLKEGNEYAYEITTYFEKKYMTFDDKLREIYEYLNKYGNVPFTSDTKIKFSNGEIMGYFISHNRKKIGLLDNDMARAITRCLDGRVFHFEDKIDEIYLVLLKNGKLTNKDLFSDGLSMMRFIFDNKKRMISENSEKVRFILEYFENRKLTFEKKLEEAYLFLNENGFLPSSHNKDICFSDETHMGYWIYKHLDEITSFDNIYSKAIVSYLEGKKFTFDDKFNEIYNYLLLNGEIPRNSKFSNGEDMWNFLNHNIEKIKFMNDEKALLITNYLDERKGLSFADKIKELYVMCLNDIVLDKNSSFSDGVNIKGWLSDNKGRLAKLKDDESISYIWSKCFKRTFEEKVMEAYNYICEYECVPLQSDEVRFTDGTLIGMWLSNNKREIYYSDDEYVILLKNKILEIRCNFFGRIKTLKI